MTDYTNVSARAMLVSLRISTWDAQRYDREVSDEVADAKRADKSSGRYNKHLFGSRKSSRAIAPEFAAVHDAALALYNFHMENTLPWGTNGDRLLATANYYAYSDGVRTRGLALEHAAADFVAAYPRLKDEARLRLGSLYRDDDFPPVSDVRHRFTFDVAIWPVPSGGDIRVDLPADQISAIEAQINSKAESRARDAMREAWARLHQVVDRIRRAASEAEGGRRNPVFSTLMTNARETCALLARLNVGEDERLDALRKRVEDELTVIEVEDLRTDERLRADTSRRAEDIANAMSAFYSPPAAKDSAAA